jgi:hypothetical protein
MHLAGRVEDHVLRAKALFDPMPGLLPTDGDAALDDKIRVLDRARIAAYPEALRQVDDIHPVLAGWSTALADIDQSGEPGIPHRLFFGITRDMPGKLPLARIIAVGVEDAGFPRRGAETAGGLRIAVARVADNHPASGCASLTRAILANFRTGLVHAHLSDTIAREYFTNVLTRLDEIRAAAGGPLHVDTVYRALCQAFEHHRDQFFFKRSPRPKAYSDEVGFSFQTHFGFRFWLADTVPQTRLPNPDPTSVLRLCEAMADPPNWRPSGTVGPAGDVLWLAPYTGEIRRLVEEAHHTWEFAGVPTHPANRLREILGLFRRRPGDHVIALITSSDLRSLLVREGTGPFAPTIFEARSYERFRHWPPVGFEEPNHVGRTYDLNSAERRSAQDGRHGTPEMVTAPIEIPEVGQVVYVGQITEADDMAQDEATGEWQTAVGTDDDFAEEVSRGESIPALIGWLSERLRI